jgi:hypothetical protein
MMFDRLRGWFLVRRAKRNLRKEINKILKDPVMMKKILEESKEKEGFNGR